MVAYLRDMARIAILFRKVNFPRQLPHGRARSVGSGISADVGVYSEVASVATAIADGDLRQDFQPRSEHDILGNAFHKMKTLQQAIRQIMHGSEQVRDASEHLKQISWQMTSDAEHPLRKSISSQRPVNKSAKP